MATAIEFNHVGKQYRLGLVTTKTLSHDLDRWWQTAVLKKEDPYLKIGEVNDRSKAGNSEYVWALRDIDFKVEQGDVVGIIGKNGAGKSTLLKLLSKVTGPTVGTIRARGRIGALLEVGTGFHPEMTGRENIFMNGAILGMNKTEVASKIDEIIEFSGCERYIDTPVKRYSSGMKVRLGFAVAANLDPEILVVDEVLAVGDAEFQKKAIGKMREVSQGGGRTVLFVSHNMASIRKLCKSGILLENGQIAYQGTVSDTIATYLKSSKYDELDGSATKVRILNNAIRINSFSVGNNDSNFVKIIGEERRTVEFSILGEADINLNVSVEVFLYDSNEILVGTYSPTHWDGKVEHIERGAFEIHDSFELPDMLTSGEYSMTICLSQMNIEHLARIDNAARIKISGFASPITGDVFYQSYSGSLILRHGDK